MREDDPGEQHLTSMPKVIATSVKELLLFWQTWRKQREASLYHITLKPSENELS
jgi:hypothetical protein